MTAENQSDHFRAARTGPEEKLLSGFIIGAACLLAFGYLWWGRFQYYSGLYQIISYCGFAVVLFVDHWHFRRTRRDLGFRLDNLRQSLDFMLPITGILGLAILAYAAYRGSFDVDLSANLLLYFPWALLQQYALQNLLFARFRTLFRRVIPALVSASIVFALIHLPNTPLVILTLSGGILWCWMFYRFPNIIAISISQAFLAILTLAFFKFSVFHSMQIGKPGFRYEAYGAGVFVAGGLDELHRPIIVALPGPNRDAQSLLRLYRPSGELLRQWIAFPEYKFSAYAAVGDLGFEPGDEIVTAPGPGPGNPPLIRIFSCQGRQLKEFLIPSKTNYGAWVSISGGRVIAAAGPAPGQPPELFIFEPDGRMIRNLRLERLGFENGIRCGAFQGSEDGTKEDRLHLALFGTPVAVNSAKVIICDAQGRTTFHGFVAFDTTYGLNLATINIGDGQPHFLTAPGPLRGYGPHLKIFDLSGREEFSLVAYEDVPGCGGNVGSVDIDSDGRDEIILGEGCCRDGKPTVRIYNLNGKLLGQWEAF